MTKSKAKPAKRRSNRRMKHAIPGDEQEELSRQSIDELPLRALRFLRGVSTSAEIAFELEARGYGREEHEEGQRLLAASFPYAPGSPLVPPGIAEIRAHGPLLEQEAGLLRAILRAHHPARLDLFERNGKRRSGHELMSALVGLDRIAARRPGGDDARMLELLERRGFGAQRRRELLALIQAHPGAPSADEIARGKARAQAEVSARDARGLLYRWLTEWSLVAKIRIKRKDLLVRLGLASRQPRGTVSEGPAGASA